MLGIILLDVRVVGVVSAIRVVEGLEQDFGLGFLISLYGFAVFGYITASIASILVGSDARREEGVAGAKAMAELKKEIAALREELSAKSRE
ncbi:MAG: hypothetical protein R6W92_05435 [Desulfocurvibacter africanus]